MRVICAGGYANGFLFDAKENEKYFTLMVKENDKILPPAKYEIISREGKSGSSETIAKWIDISDEEAFEIFDGLAEGKYHHDAKILSP